MSFVLVSCPECEQEVFLVTDDGKGFCSNCGAELDIERDKNVRLPDSVLDTLYELAENEKAMDFSDEPWYGDLEGVRGLVSEGRLDEAAEELMGVLEGIDDISTRDDVRQAVLVNMLGNIVENNKNGIPYESGMMALANVLVLEGEFDDKMASDLPLVMLTEMDSVSATIDGEESAYAITATAFHLLRDVLENDPDIYNQGMALKSFIHLSEDILDSLAYEAPDSEYYDAVESMYNAASCIFKEMDSRMMRARDDVAEAAVKRMSENWTLGPTVSELLTRVESEGFDPTDEFWAQMQKESKLYINRYFSK